MKATRIFPLAPSCASGGIGAEQNKCSCVSISLDEKKARPAAEAWRLPPSSPPYVTASSHSLLRALVPATCRYKRVALLAAMF